MIARLSRERDEAREALSRVSVHGGQSTNGEAMQVDSSELSRDLVAKVEATQEKYVDRIHHFLSHSSLTVIDFRRQGENGLYQIAG